ncbi:hypothetical protein DEO72_LG5g858 [Vigna unguiculata]|uniref:Uncharacterized protein n=1 Tax=Vigna unguiculata TaxID=3917 RepID=A0A4D6LUQ4_VIGUN|nr:hypothetical protein DEO72_LG5g858 [Vigna unguiculata]
MVSSSTRLGKPFSPERDNTSLKTRIGRLSEMLEQNQGELLLFSARRDELAWARIPALTTVPRMQHQKQLTQTTQFIHIRAQAFFKSFQA